VRRRNDVSEVFKMKGIEGKRVSVMSDDRTVIKVKVKVIPQKAEEPQWVPGRLRPRIFLTFGTTRVVGRQA
jgi:hypothetical protein